MTTKPPSRKQIRKKLPPKPGNKPYVYIPPPPPPPPLKPVNPSIPSPRIINSAPPVTNFLNLTAARAGDPEPYIFGECVADGKLIAADDTWYNVYIDVLWGVGEIESIDALVIDNEPAYPPTYVGPLEHFTGTATQAASAVMLALKGTYDTLPNKAHSVVSLIPNQSLDKRALVHGLKLYDPRTATTVYSTNPALALARVIVDAGYTINWGSVTNAANYCDENFSGSSPTLKRWEIGGQIKERRDAQDWIQLLATYANCFVDTLGSEVYLIPDEPRSSNHTIGADDMIEGTVRTSYAGGNNVPDSVTVNGLTVDGEVISYTYGTSQGAGTETTLNMPFYQTAHAIGRKAEETWRKARNNLTLEFTTFDDGIHRTIGDVGSITNAQYGLSNQLMTLVEQKQVSGGRWQKKYYQYEASNYSDILYTLTTNWTGLYNPYNPPSGPTPTAVEELVTEGGVTRSRFKITFLGIVWAYIKEYAVTAYRISTGEVVLLADLSPLGTVTHTTYTTGDIVSGAAYRFEVRIRSIVNAVGNPGTADATSTEGPNALLTYGALTNMHVYVLDGDGLYCTSSEKTGSPETGITWAARFTDSPAGSAWSSGETWLGNQIFDTVFQTEVWDSGQVWSGRWKWTDLNVTRLAGATRSNAVALSGETSPISFTDYSGTSTSLEARYMKAKCSVINSPQTAGEGLHIKLPIPVDFALGL